MVVRNPRGHNGVLGVVLVDYSEVKGSVAEVIHFSDWID
jgi:hypothetical protein